MTPDGFYQVAVALMSRQDPGSPRSAISRAYYATYHTAVQALEGIGISPGRGPGGHQRVQDLLSNADDGELATVASKIGDFRSKRIAADYHLSDTSVENQKTARCYVNLAKDLMVRVGTCFSDKHRATRIGHGIRARVPDLGGGGCRGR